jgi:hypothetical protein
MCMHGRHNIWISVLLLQAGVKRSALGAFTGTSLFLTWVILFQLNWRTWGRKAVDFMIYAPNTYTTGW